MHIIFHCRVFLSTTHRPFSAVIFLFCFLSPHSLLDVFCFFLLFPLLDCGILLSLFQLPSKRDPRCPFSDKLRLPTL